MILNKKMKKIIYDSDYCEDLKENILEFCKNYIFKTKMIRDCIIYDQEGDLDEGEINFERALQFHGDWTGYEASCNEIRVTDYLDIKKKNMSNIFEILNYLKKELLNMYPNRNFCIIISIDESDITVRFHTYREEEGMWISEDLESYDNPILYEIF